MKPNTAFTFVALCTGAALSLSALSGVAHAQDSGQEASQESVEESVEKSVEKSAPLSEEQGYVLDAVVVTTTREAKSKSEVAESITVLDEDTIDAVAPSHPSELLNRAAGVHVNNLGGEGHMTAIRQPITTRGVYLFLEDGVPVRPTGFFNHNALYEVNIPQSGRVEVVKGPGSALYGSDAIGGMINVLTPPSPLQPTARINLEAGSHGWQRALLSAGTSTDKHGVSVAFNHTENDGYRDESEYDRSSLTSRWDYFNDTLHVKTLLSYTEVNQSGVSSLEYDDYRYDTKKNRFHGDVAFREVEALRISSEWSFEQDNGLLSFIPFYRNNTTAMAPSWMVTYDPNERKSEFQSFGLLTKYRYNLNDTDQLIVGFDVDHSPSRYTEQAISHSQNGDIYTGYQTLGAQNYDFDAEQTSLSPYVHYEGRWHEKWVTTLGVRYDYFTIRYEDNLDPSDPNSVFIPQLGRPVTHLRPDDQRISFDNVSPKLGVIYYFHDNHELYSNYRHAFTIPSVGTLFRSGTTENTDELKPIKAESVELGFRGVWGPAQHYEAALYGMWIEDDLVTVVDGFERNIYNAGETEHRGIELSVWGAITPSLHYSVAFSRAEHEYKSFSYSCCFPSQNVDVSGNDVGKAPETIGNVVLAYEPAYVKGLRLEAEWEHLGEYYTDETNTSRYDGHDLYNVRASYPLSKHFEVYGRVLNISDVRYSTYTSSQVGDPDISYRPGLPRTYYAGFKWTL